MSLLPASKAARALMPRFSRAQPAAFNFNLNRFMAAAAGLDKSEVTERLLNCVKNFDKVDPSKVRSTPVS